MMLIFRGCVLCSVSFNLIFLAMLPGGEPVYALNQLYHVEVLEPLVRVLSDKKSIHSDIYGVVREHGKFVPFNRVSAAGR